MEIADETVKEIDVKQPSEEKVPDSSENGVQQKTKPTKGKKRKKVKDVTAPRHPLTGYVRFLNDRREGVRKDNPSLAFADITKILAGEWGSLPSDKKQHYLDAAEIDRERYAKEFKAYRETDAYKLFVEQQNDKKAKTGSTDEENKTNNIPKNTQSTAPNLKETQETIDFNNFDIPIFTEEFLDHNKTRDAELRQLRKSNTDYEQQNAILQKHIENMKNAIVKLETEITTQEKNNSSLQKHLDHLRTTLTNGFAGVKLPGLKERPTLQSIDSYMTNLHSILLESSSNDTSLLMNVRNIMSRLDFGG